MSRRRQAVAEYNASFLSPLSEHERAQLAGTLAKLYVTTAEGRPKDE